MKKTAKLKHIFFQISALLIVVAASLQMFEPDIAKYLMIIGAAGFAAIVFTSPYPGKSIKGKRIFNFQIFAAILIVVSAYLMFVKVTYWPITLLVAALLTLYSSIRLPQIYKKETEE